MTRYGLLVLASAVLFATWHYIRADESPATSCGPNRGHDCHCPRMLLQRRTQQEEACMAIQDREAHDKCLEAIPHDCAMLEQPRRDPDTGAAEPDACYKWCRLDLCFCNDMRCGSHGEDVPVMQIPAPKRKGKKK
jgi:hypothetical protein